MTVVAEGIGSGYRVPEFRTSSMPYCPVLHALATPYGEEKYRSDFFFLTGTAIHELIQKWAARMTKRFQPTKHGFRPRLYGDWKCSGCGAVKSGRTKPLSPCSCHNRYPHVEWVYKEVTLQWKDLSGHVDTILQIDDDAYIVVDYKTTLFKFGGGALDRKKFPYDVNVYQIETYCALLRELYGLNIVGWALAYIDRSKPIEGPRDFHVSASSSWDAEDHQRLMRRLRWANTANKPASAVLARRMAGKRPMRADIAATVAARPCTTTERWALWMKPKFKYETGGVCPHLKTCTCGNTARIEKYFTKLMSEPLD